MMKRDDPFSLVPALLSPLSGFGDNIDVRHLGGDTAILMKHILYNIFPLKNDSNQLTL
jgi:hypothetical protein